MSEFRQDRTTGAWVLVAPERGRRPGQRQRRDIAAAPAFEPDCPFCPGNERQLPGIIEETASDEAPGWRVRVVPNKYPALTPQADMQASTGGAGSVRAGHGFHEVIIETARHDADPATLSESDLRAVIRAYQRRYVELAARPGIEAVLVFRNHGRGAGASLPHPHAQVVATGMMPPQLAVAAAWARAQYAETSRCPTCEALEFEQNDGRRIVETGERHLLMVPFAAASPFEQWLLPRRHQASFAQADDGELAEFGRLLRRALYRLKSRLGDPPYNFVIESGTVGGADAHCLHWRLRLVPDMVRPGGFELGAGLPINPSRPEDDAQSLRGAAAMSDDGAN